MVDYKERVARDVPPIQSPHYERFSGLYFFLSLDLVNSTAYKARNPDWKFLIRMFYDEARDFWVNRQGSFRPSTWKYAGDEVLFYSRIGSVADLAHAVQTSAAAVDHVCRTVEAWSVRTTPRLYIKGTCWCAYAEYQPPAPVSEVAEGKSQSRNIVFETPFVARNGLPSLDFLGPEIDAGFRISSASAKKALVVSPEIAWILRTRGERAIGDCLRIVEYRELKGVWEGRHYPIVWYRPSWQLSALSQDYEYDDQFRNSALAGAYSAKADSCDALPQVLAQVGTHSGLALLELPIDGPAPTEPESATLATAESEVHAVAVCFTDDGKVLVARRLATKEVMPALWEAGCAKLRAGDDFFQAMKRDYRADFSLDLDFSPFGSWGVVGTYSFTKRNQVIPGVIFAARVIDGTPLTHPKHAEARWIDPENLPEDVVMNGVPQLSVRIAKAYKLWTDARANGFGSCARE